MIRDITVDIQNLVGAKPDGIWGMETATKVLKRIATNDATTPPPVVIPIRPTKTREYSQVVREELDTLWATCRITASDGRFNWTVHKLHENLDRYTRTAREVNPKMPWWFVGLIHGLESSFNFRTHLHNGDSLKARTVNVPAGRPETGHAPFSWEESAIDALTMDGKRYDKQDDWSIARCLWRLEGFNGYGYRLHRGIHTPYLWAGTNHYVAGKYVSDGKYDADAVSKQAGCAGTLKILLTKE
jgi:lysozyme family protein